MIHYLFDGSFIGLLTCVFESFEMKEKNAKVFLSTLYQPSVFDEYREIFSDQIKAERVWNGFSKKVDKSSLREFYLAYLSEDAKTFQHLFNLMIYVFDNKQNVSRNFGNSDVLAVAQMAKSVSREKHRMEAFIRFKKASDGLFYALVNPDFNVLPLIQTHFKNRYADQSWLIYDEKRKFALYYDLNKVDFVQINFTLQDNHNSYPSIIVNDDKEELYDLLWKDYFKSTNIVERKNTKLHLQHVPKRYWKYLNEK